MSTPHLEQWVIDCKLDLTSESALRGYDRSTCIFSAPKELLNEHKDAYVPRIISIGPYHFRKVELSEMERFKGEAVRRELIRIRSKTGISEFSFDRVIDKIQGRIGEILRCYDKEIPYSGEVVCWMMARDACFILEFYRCYVCQIKEMDRLCPSDEDVRLQEPLHPIFGLESENHVVKSEIRRDLIKLENQIPLFVLEEVLAMEQIVAPEDVVPTEEILAIEQVVATKEVLVATNEVLVATEEASSSRDKLKEAREKLKEATVKLKEAREKALHIKKLEKAKPKLQNLLKDMFDNIYYQPFEQKRRAGDQSLRQNHNADSQSLKQNHSVDRQSPRQNHRADAQSPMQNHILDIYYYCYLGDVKDSKEPEKKKLVHRICFKDVNDPKEPEEKHKRSKFLSAAELNNGGVKIQANGEKVEDVGFEGRTLSIPQIKVNMDSEIYIRNLIALEICSPYGYSKRMTAFSQFMNELCQAENGAAVLREKGVIVGNLWQHSEVTRFFSSCKQSPLVSNHHSIERTRKKLKKYSRRTCCISSAKVWKEFGNAYFLKPWLLFGGIGAIIVLLLTATQVFCLFRSCGVR